jgi:chemotaxis protein histidine kinase CheA
MHRRRRRIQVETQDDVRVRGRRPAARAPETRHAIRRLAAGRETINDVISLQRTLGNNALQRAIAKRNDPATLMRSGEDSPADPAKDNPFFSADAPKQLFKAFNKMMAEIQKASIENAASQVKQMFEQLDAAQELAEKTREQAEQEAAEQILAAIASAATVAVVVSAARSTEVEAAEKRQFLDAAISTTSAVPALSGLTSNVTKASIAIETGNTDAQINLVNALGDLADGVIKKSEEALEQTHKDVALAVEELKKMLHDFATHGAQPQRA